MRPVVLRLSPRAITSRDRGSLVEIVGLATRVDGMPVAVLSSNPDASSWSTDEWFGHTELEPFDEVGEQLLAALGAAYALYMTTQRRSGS